MICSCKILSQLTCRNVNVGLMGERGLCCICIKHGKCICPKEFKPIELNPSMLIYTFCFVQCGIL